MNWDIFFYDRCLPEAVSLVGSIQSNNSTIWENWIRRKWTLKSVTWFYKDKPCFEAQTSQLHSGWFFTIFKKIKKKFDQFLTLIENYNPISAYSGQKVVRICLDLTPFSALCTEPHMF